MTALQVIEKHVVLTARFDSRSRVVAQSLGDDIGHDPKTLPEFVHEAEREFAVAHKRADKKEPWRNGAFIIWAEEWATRGAPLFVVKRK